MVHTFCRGGLYLALDVGSGCVHVLTRPAYDVLRGVSESEIRSGILSGAHAELLEAYGKAPVEEIFGELAALAKEEKLYTDDNYRALADTAGEMPVKAMCLHVAHDCDLRCRYCFASTGNFGGRRKLMNADVAARSIDLLVRLSEGRHNLEVDFFGGEPLLNFDVVRQTVDYARSIEDNYGKHFRFTLTTNGFALNEDSIAYINREMDNVVLSLDGRKEINDRMRLLAGGGSAFEAIVPKLQRLVSLRGEKEYYVRGTYTRENMDFDADVLELYRLGFTQISVEPVVGTDSEPYAIRRSELAAAEQSYERLMNKMLADRKNIGAGFNFFHFMLDLDGGPCAVKRVKGCGSGNEYIAVTPDGEIYPCHQFVGKREFLMGNIDEGITRQDLKRQFAGAVLANKRECQSCWAQYFCSGGCNANNHGLCGDMLKPHGISCELERIRVECAIAIQASAKLHKT